MNKRRIFPDDLDKIFRVHLVSPNSDELLKENYALVRIVSTGSDKFRFDQAMKKGDGSYYWFAKGEDFLFARHPGEEYEEVDRLTRVILGMDQWPRCVENFCGQRRWFYGIVHP